MKRIIITISALLIIFLSASGQDYKTGIGFRGGLSQGLTVKHFIAPGRAIEGLLSSRWRGFHITGLYEIHAPAFNIDRLYWYYGYGGHLGSWDKDSRNPWWDDTTTHTVIGVDGIIGLEFNIGEIPFTIGLDYKPAFNILGHFGFWGDEFALSVRYVW